MAVIQHTGGFGGSTGAPLATASGPITQSGVTYYVNSVGGVDAAAPAGQSRLRPLATAAQAFTNAGNNDIIVFLSGHIQTPSAVQVISQTGLTILGEGTGTSRPQFIRNVGDELWDITGAGCWIDNIYFPAVTTSGAFAKVRVGAASARISRCQFDGGALDSGAALLSLITGATNVLIEHCTFTSTASRPAGAIEVVNAISDLTLDTCTFDGGSFDWTSAAVLFTAAVTRFRAINCSVLNGSDFSLGTGGGSVGWVHFLNRSASAVLTWA